jgi:hypothetical protein
VRLILLSLALCAPSRAQVAPTAASTAELEFAAKAPALLAKIADDLGAERGWKASSMRCSDFLGLLKDARAVFQERYAPKAPSPAAARAASKIQGQALRIVSAMGEGEAPLSGRIRIILGVWNVFNQEIEAAAAKGTLEALEAEARLFARQVESSAARERRRRLDSLSESLKSLPPGRVFDGRAASRPARSPTPGP